MAPNRKKWALPNGGLNLDANLISGNPFTSRRVPQIEDAENIPIAIRSQALWRRPRERETLRQRREGLFPTRCAQAPEVHGPKEEPLATNRINTVQEADTLALKQRSHYPVHPAGCSMPTSA